MKNVDVKKINFFLKFFFFKLFFLKKNQSYINININIDKTYVFVLFVNKQNDSENQLITSHSRPYVMSEPGTFLHNICGKTLLRLVSRGSALIAELLRLSENVPDIFLGKEDRLNRHMKSIVFDFTYLKMPEKFEARINANDSLLDADHECQERYFEILERFYLLFESICKYHGDFAKFLKDLVSGFYIQHSIDGVLSDVTGKQLLCEALYLFGTILFLMERKLPGIVRENLLISYMRYKGESALVNLESVLELCKSTGYVYTESPHPPTSATDMSAPGSVDHHMTAITTYLETESRSKPQGLWESLFARFPIDTHASRMIVATLQTDDIYSMARAYPSPDHRSTALGSQASMIFVTLFFTPDYLKTKKNTMREIVDRFFCDNWVIPVYMGCLVDLQMEWKEYPAASRALANTIDAEWVAEVQQKNNISINEALQENDRYLTQGILTDDYLLDNMPDILDTLRKSNASMRWLLLHRRICNKQIFGRIAFHGTEVPVLVNLMLATSQLEYLLKANLKRLLETKLNLWETSKNKCASQMGELSLYFTGELALTRVERDDALVEWFAKIKQEILSMEFEDKTSVGRRIQTVMHALQEIEQYTMIDSNVQVKHFLAESRKVLYQMVRVLGLDDTLLSNIDLISDMSYAWDLIDDYLENLQKRIQEQPQSVSLLRALFLKLASIMDYPLVRISQAGSADTISVAAHYSQELVNFVRKVLEVIPKSMFDVLVEIIHLQSKVIKPLASKVDITTLGDMEQADERYHLSQMTFQVSTFTEGILAMHKTLFGVLEVDPKQVLEDGIRKELVQRVTTALDRNITFAENPSRRVFEMSVRNHLKQLAVELGAIKGSFEYIQDYINMNGLQIWQSEYSRIMSYFLEQESKRYCNSHILDFKSKYQSVHITIPRLFETNGKSFLSRLLVAIEQMTSPNSCIYSPEWCEWFDRSNAKVVGDSALFRDLRNAVGVEGLCALNVLIGHRIVESLQIILDIHASTLEEELCLEALNELSVDVKRPLPNGNKKSTGIFDNTINHLLRLSGYKKLIPALMTIGQLQLIQQHINGELEYEARTDSGLLHAAVVSTNHQVVSTLKHNGDMHPDIAYVQQIVERCGIRDPVNKVYLTCAPCPHLVGLLSLGVIHALQKMEYDTKFATLSYTNSPLWLSRSGKMSLDSTPLVYGVVTLLRQFHPDYSTGFITYMSKFVKMHLMNLHSDALSRSDSQNISQMLSNTMYFLSEYTRCAMLDDDYLDHYIPTFLLESMRLQFPSSSMFG